MQQQTAPIVEPMHPGGEAQVRDSHASAPAVAAARSRVVPRWRIWLGVLLMVAAGAASLLRALQEPSLGLRFSVASDGPAAGQVMANSTRGEARVFHGVVALQALGGKPGPDTAGLRQELAAIHLVESAGVINRYADQDRFYADHWRLWTMLQAGQVRLDHAGGSAVMATSPKRLGELGLRFWFPWLLGLMSFAVGWGIWCFSPRRSAARFLLISSTSYAFAMLLVAPTGSRLLTQEPTLWEGLYLAAHGVAFLQSIGLILLLWYFPTRLRGRWFVLFLHLACAVWLAVDLLRWVDTVSLGFRLPMVLLGLVLLVLYGRQWQLARDDPAKRGQLKWLGLLLVLGLAAIVVAYAYAATGATVDIPQAYGLGWTALLYLGLVPLITRVGLFQLEAWWARAWLWMLGGMLVLVLDLLLVGLVHLQESDALLVATAVAGWLYFPLRQWLWQRLARDRLEGAEALLPNILALAGQASLGPGAAALHSGWLDLWERAFAPLTLQVQSGAEASARTGVPTDDVSSDGQRLLIPASSGLPALVLGLAGRGARLYNPGDVEKARQILRLLRTSLEAQGAFERGARQERQRIAADLHDDLGASLLSIAQSPSADRSAQLARQALDELRLSVRGLAGSSQPLHDAMADWRAELVGRLRSAAIEAHWEDAVPDSPATPLASEPAPHILGAQPRAQLTRILREAVSNVIKHSGATQCWLRWGLVDRHLSLEIIDNGRGLQGGRMQAQAEGMGLGNLERRVRRLGGTLVVEDATGGGLRLSMRVLLQDLGPAPSANIRP